ncbi:MAG: hypothetical protein IKC75_06305, partial [Clostridia bacterium]|nr:hypothetical protein [Clostridia bacterium]
HTVLHLNRTHVTTKKELLIDKSSFFVYPSRRLGISSAVRRHIIKGGAPPLHLITRQRAFSCGLMISNPDGLMIYRNKLRMIYKACALISFAGRTGSAPMLCEQSSSQTGRILPILPKPSGDS